MSPDHAHADEQQIRALLETRLAALREKDASQFVAAFDASIVKFDLAPPLRETGFSALDPVGLQRWLNTWDGEVIVELAQLNVTVCGDVAFCHCLEHIHSRAQLRAIVHGWLRPRCPGPATMKPATANRTHAANSGSPCYRGSVAGAPRPWRPGPGRRASRTRMPAVAPVLTPAVRGLPADGSRGYILTTGCCTMGTGAAPGSRRMPCCRGKTTRS
jgi:ketosteroid isomerase-like protein